jgi:5-methylcytosine-specific restriction endonuclease McrA
MKHKRKKRSPELEQKILRMLTGRALHKQDGKCYHCATPITFEEATGDHYPIPRYRGGKTRADNIVAACNKCNGTRNAETNRQGGKLDHTCGDPTPHSPFEVLAKLKEQLNDRNTGSV